MARRRRGRQISFSTIFIVIIALALAAYVIYLMYNTFVDKTAVIESGDMGNQYAAQAVVVRHESLVDAEGLTRISYYANEGEPIYTGSKIAEAYASGYSQTDMNKLLQVRSNIKDHLKTLLASEYNDAQLDRYDMQVMDYARELGMLVLGKAEGNLLNLERQMTTVLGHRQQHLKDKYGSKDSTLIGYYETESTLQKKIQNWTTTYIADSDCVISFYTDGWENVLAQTEFDRIAPEQVRNIVAGNAPPQTTSQRGRTSIFRKVNPMGWNLLLLSNDKYWNPVIGQTYKVRLESFDDHIVDAQVTSFERMGTELLVRMQVPGSVTPFLNVRTAPAVVGESYVSGLKVPVTALHPQGDMMGVVLSDRDGRSFVPVEVIMQDNSYAVVQSLVPGALMEGQRVRVF